MPYRSKAQWKWGAINFSKDRHDQWAKESPDFDSLPEHAPKEKKEAALSEPRPPQIVFMSPAYSSGFSAQMQKSAFGIHPIRGLADLGLKGIWGATKGLGRALRKAPTLTLTSLFGAGDVLSGAKKGLKANPLELPRLE